MDNYALVIKQQLMAIMDYMASKKEEFVKAPEKDFTRNRKLSFKDTIILMLSMGGGSLNNELMKYFNYNRH